MDKEHLFYNYYKALIDKYHIYIVYIEFHSVKYQELGNAVIIQAVEDWRAAVRHLRKHPTSMAAKKCIRETETFFLSEYFTLLTNYNGHTLLRRLKEEFHTCQR